MPKFLKQQQLQPSCCRKKGLQVPSSTHQKVQPAAGRTSEPIHCETGIALACDKLPGSQNITREPSKHSSVSQKGFALICDIVAHTGLTGGTGT